MKAYWIAAPVAACVLLSPSMAVAQSDDAQTEGAQLTEDPVVEDIPDPATLTMPTLAFVDSPDHAEGFKKYFYFHRADTTYADAYRDIRECDALASGSSIYMGASEGAIAGAMANYGLLAGGIGGAVGGIIADAIFGSALRREQRRTNLRNCMSFKGYGRYGLAKDLWVAFNFEEGLGRKREPVRLRALALQALVASGPVGEGARAVSALRIAAAFAAAAMLVPAGATAASISEKDVTSGKIRIDPASGYIMISGAERQMGMFIRVPDADTWREWEADRLKAFTKAQRKYPSQLARWESQAAIAKQTRAAIPDRPEEPKLERFMIDPIELRDIESYGPMYVYSKGTTVTYVNSVKPGTWIWYGPIMMVPNGTSVGSCNCMGTVKFEVKPGVLTDLGNSLALLPQWDSEKDVARLFLDELNAKRAANGKAPLKTLNTGQLSYGAPASLAAWPTAKAELQASGKLNNFYGLTISRVAPIPGVLAYKRDTIVDVRTGKEIESPTIVSRAKIKK